MWAELINIFREPVCQSTEMADIRDTAYTVDLLAPSSECDKVVYANWCIAKSRMKLITVKGDVALGRLLQNQQVVLFCFCKEQSHICQPDWLSVVFL